MRGLDNWVRGYFAGMFVLTCMHGLRQDWMGVDAYLRKVRADWIYLPWWFWLMPITATLLTLGYKKPPTRRP